MSLRRKPADGQQRKLPPCVSAIKTALADSRRVGHLVLCPQSVRAHALLGKKKAAGGTDGLCISMVEMMGFEPMTSRLSAERANQAVPLAYDNVSL